MDVSRYEALQEMVCPVCSGRVIVQGHIDRFSLKAVSGKGGTGTVYQAHDPHLGRLVALKVVRQDKAANEEVLQQLLAEAGVTASVNHPNVVRVYSVGTSQGRFFMAMEMVGGGSLDDLMEKQGQLPEAQVLDIAIQIAGGLQAAHQVGLVHRDIKPGNILFADPRTAKLADFGLAIFEQHVAATGEVWGTPYYMPPERLKGEPEDLRGDIFALGATLFHALAGRPPYEAADSTQVALKRLQVAAPSVLSFAPTVSNATAFVIKKMLEMDPAARFASYPELIESLQFARNELGTKPAAKARVVVDSQQGSQSGMWVTVACLGVLAVGGIAAYFMFGGSSSTPANGSPESAPTDAPAAVADTGGAKSEVSGIEPGVYQILNRKSDLALNLANSGSADGNEVCLWSQANSLNEQWIVKPDGNGLSRVLTFLYFKGLDVRNGSSDNKTPISQWSVNTGKAQKWRFRQVETGWYVIFAECSGKALTMIPEREAGGASIGQRDYTGGPEQQWRFERSASLPDTLDAIDAAVSPTMVARPPVRVHTATGSPNSHFVQFDITAAATADSRQGLYGSASDMRSSVQAQLRGPVEVAGVPFTILDANRTSSGKDQITLKCAQGDVSKKYPQRVEIPVGNVALSKIHVVGGIAGWGYPWSGDNDKHLGLVAAKITVFFQGGGTQEIVLRNGYEICDHVVRDDPARDQPTPGSALIEGFANDKNQLRYFSKPITDLRPVEKIQLESFNNQVAPSFYALTGEKR